MGVGGVAAANLRQVISGETYEHQVMYRRFAEQARADGGLEAAKLFSEIVVDEGRHRDAFRTALTDSGSGWAVSPADRKRARLSGQSPQTSSSHGAKEK
jgi:rubrerythrin